MLPYTPTIITHCYEHLSIYRSASFLLTFCTSCSLITAYTCGIILMLYLSILLSHCEIPSSLRAFRKYTLREDQKGHFESIRFKDSLRRSWSCSYSMIDRTVEATRQTGEIPSTNYRDHQSRTIIRRIDSIQIAKLCIKDQS